MRLIDAHLHLSDDRLWPTWREQVARAAEARVWRMVDNAARESDWPRVQETATLPRVLPCLGVHPWHVGDAASGWQERLRDVLLQHPRAGVGEIGLDRWIAPRNEAAQEEAFRFQLGLATDLKRPVMVHCLRAWGWLQEVLRSAPIPKEGGLLHAYGGSPELVPLLAEAGFYFSFGASLLSAKKTRARESLLRVPLERLLLETDAPDMPPPGVAMNTPDQLPKIYACAAGLLGRPLEELARQIEANACRFFAPLLRDDGVKTGAFAFPEN